MSQINIKSISGITSITTPAGVDNVFTVHSNDTTERFRVDQTGNINIAGIVTVTKDLDVDGHTNLDNVSIAGVTTFVGNVNIANDTGKIQIGASQDLQFYHDYSGGSENSHIYQTTSKHLLISAYTQFARVNGTWGVLNLGNSHNMLRATAGSDVKLYFNNGEKLATTNTGINVTGNVVSDGLVVDGNTDLNGDLDVDGHTNLDNVSIAGVTTVTNNYFDFKPTGGGNAHLRMLSTGSGDAGIFFDAANGDISGSDYCFIGQKNNLDFVIDANANAGNIDFQRAGTTQVRIDSNGKLTMSSGTVELQSHMIRVGNRTTSQINAGVSTSTGSVTLDTTTNNLLYYANAQWNTVKRVGNDGSTQQLAARSAKALLDDGITTNGVYWLDMHGAYSLGNAKLHYCLMDSSYDGGGWTMLYSMNHGNNFASGSNYSFSVNVGNPTTINDFTAGNWGYDRRNTFTPAANDQFLIRRSDNNDWKRFVVSNWSPTDNSVSNGWETLRLPNGSNTGHPQWATGQMYDSSGSAVSGHIYFNGCAMGGNCNSGGGDGSGFGNYSQWLDAVGNSAFGGGYNSQSNGGSPLYWGQGNALTQGGTLYIQMFYRKAGTQ